MNAIRRFCALVLTGVTLAFSLKPVLVEAIARPFEPPKTVGVYLNTGTGRFFTSDGDGYGNNEDPLSLHKYLYAQADPVDNDDPSGHDIGDFDLDSFLDSFSIGGLGAQIETLARSTALQLDTTVMNLIVKNAMSDIGSWKWSTTGTFEKYGTGVNKCNLFWAYEAKRSGAYIPNTSGTRFYGLFHNNPPTAQQLGDPMYIIYDWPVIKSPVPGAVVAGGDHVGIVASDDVSSISVFHGQYIINNNWAFRANQPFNPVFRGYTGW